MPKRKYQLNRIKTRRCYTIEDIAEKLEVDKRTVLNWFKSGLIILVKKRPYLIYGGHLIDFLKEQKRNWKIPIGPGEFLCTICRCGRKGLPTSIEYEKPNKLIGVCEVCGSDMFLFSPKKPRKCVRRKRSKKIIITEQLPLLFGNVQRSVNFTFKEVKKSW